MLWLRARRAMFDPNPNEISNQTLIPNDAWNDGSCASDHERLESGAVQNWLGARVRAVLYCHMVRPRRREAARATAKSQDEVSTESAPVLLSPPAPTRPGGDKIYVMSTYLIIALTT